MPDPPLPPEPSVTPTPAPSAAAELELGALEATLPPSTPVRPHLPGTATHTSTDLQGEPS